MKINERQKLLAISAKHLAGLEWKPKVGDLYTSYSAQLDLYEIVSEDRLLFHIEKNGDNKKNRQLLSKISFNNNGGGDKIYVPLYILMQ